MSVLKFKHNKSNIHIFIEPSDDDDEEDTNDLDEECGGIDKMKVRGIQRTVLTTKQISKPSSTAQFGK